MLITSLVLFMEGFFVLAAITAFLGAIPAMISLFSSIFNFIKDEVTLLEKKALADKLAAAIKVGTTTGDTSAIENILKSGNQS